MSFERDVVVIFCLFAVYICIGLAVYEAWGTRLGGVLVLPFLVLYSLLDPVALIFFAFVATVTLLGGQIVHMTTLIYGRRIFVVFMLLSIASSLIVSAFIETSFQRVMMPVLPGLFAYNIHREGRAVRNILAFLGVLILFFTIAYAVLTITGVSPDESSFS